MAEIISCEEHFLRSCSDWTWLANTHFVQCKVTANPPRFLRMLEEFSISKVLETVNIHNGGKPSHKAMFTVEQMRVPGVCRYGFNALDEVLASFSL